MKLFTAMLMAVSVSSSAFATVDPSPREIRRENRIYAKFERQYKRLSKHILILTERYSEEELQAIFEKSTIETGNIIHEIDFTRMSDEMIKSKGSIKDALLSIREPEFKAKLKEQLASEIESAGSATQFLKNSRRGLNSVSPCAWKKVGLISAATLVATGFGAIGGSAIAGTLSSSVGTNVWVFIGAIVGTGVDAAMTGEFASRMDCKLRRR